MNYKLIEGTCPAVEITLGAGESVKTQSGGMSWMSSGIKSYYISIFVKVIISTFKPILEKISETWNLFFITCHVPFRFLHRNFYAVRDFVA